jgi:TPR repeat protein
MMHGLRHPFGAPARQQVQPGRGLYATALVLGQGVAPDRMAALAWLNRAAELGHAKSLNILGGFHEDGWEVPADEDAALALYRRAAEGGDFRGHFNLARLLARRGQIEQALQSLDRVPERATPAFLAKAADFLLASGDARLRAKGQAFRAMLRTG